MAAGWIVFLGVLAALCWLLGAGEKRADNGTIVVAVLRTGQDADCIVIQNGSRAVMIDTGSAQDEDKILEYLQTRKIERIDSMILTTPKEEHIGNAVRLLEMDMVGNIIAPYYAKQNEEMGRINRICQQKDIPVIYPTKTKKMILGGMNLLVYPPLEKNYENINNYSLAVLLEHKDVKMVFVGDAAEKRTEELLMVKWPEANLYKVADHGRANALTGKLLLRLKPEFAVVTAKKGDSIICDTCSSMETELFFTGEEDQIFLSDGKKIVKERE